MALQNYGRYVFNDLPSLLSIALNGTTDSPAREASVTGEMCGRVMNEGCPKLERLFLTGDSCKELQTLTLEGTCGMERKA